MYEMEILISDHTDMNQSKFGFRSNEIRSKYSRLNKVLLLWLVLIFIYPIFTKTFKISFLCQYKAKYHKECFSCGLTRGFAECYKGNFKEAQLYNVHSTFLFIIIISQILMRAVFTFGKPNKNLMFDDIAISFIPIITYVVLVSTK